MCVRTRTGAILIDLTHVNRPSSQKKRSGSVRESCRRDVRVKIETADDIVLARQLARAVASEAGFSACDATLITTAVSEMTRNVLEYASRGEVAIAVVRHGRKEGVQISVRDQGPGITDVAQVMQDGYSSRRGMGIGLPGTKRLMDEFTITSTVGCGTTVVMKKWNS